MLRFTGFLLFFLSLVASPAAAQEWAERMFNKVEHDFGTVARGANTVYKFEVTNIYKQTMKITGVTSSCGCTTPTIENATIGTHKKAFIVAKFNTRTFVGRHGATLTVSFAPPFSAKVQVRVHGNIRSDVVFSPGSVNFGTVDEGVAKEQKVQVTYAGRSNWSITDVTNDNDHFEVELNELTRQSGKVTYDLLVRLKDNIPAGYIKDELTVVTNDQRAESQRIPLYVEGHIIPEISVTPETLVLGDVLTGETVTRKIVVRGKKPFRILDVSCEDDCFTFKSSGEQKQIHLVELIYLPKDYSGAIKAPVTITTDVSNRPATINVSASVTDIQAEASGEPVEAAKEKDDQSRDTESADQVVESASS